MARNGKTAEDIDHDIPGVWVEAKRPARCAVWTYMDQAQRDAGGKVPLVLVRADRRETLAIIPLADLRRLCECVAGIEGRPVYPKGAECESE